MRFLLLITLVWAINPGIAAPADESFETLPGREYGYSLFRYLYRWILDADRLAAENEHFMDREIEVWVRPLDPERDPDDRSLFAEVLIPGIQAAIILKKADYSIPELGVTVHNDDYRIVSINRYRIPAAPREAYLITTYQGQEVFETLYATRNEKSFPDKKTRASLADALMVQIQVDAAIELEGDQTFYLAPLSSVTNDIWVFWENQRRFIKFTSDTDYDTPFYWQHHQVGVDIFDLDTDIVISLSEMPGSNAYMTKDFAGRVLFNCIVLGMKIVVPAEKVEARLQDED